MFKRIALSLMTVMVVLFMFTANTTNASSYDQGTTQPVKEFKLSTENKMIFGVAAGIAEYFNIDPTIIRVAFVISFICLGVGVIPYTILWIVM